MTQPKKREQPAPSDADATLAAPKPMTMDDIATRFLSTPPTPHKPPPKKKTRKARK